MNKRAKYLAAWGRANYARLKNEKRCTRCRKRTRRETMCLACDEKRKKQRRELRKLGFCRCGREARGGWRQCGECQEEDRARKRARVVGG